MYLCGDLCTFVHLRTEKGIRSGTGVTGSGGHPGQMLGRMLVCVLTTGLSPVPPILNIKYFSKDLVSLIPAQRIIPSSILLVYRI